MIHIFDVDDTIMKNTSTWYFLMDAIKEGVIHFPQVSRLPFDWIKYKLGRPDMDFIENTVSRLSGLKKSDLERIAATCFEHRIKPRLYTGAVQLIRELQSKGERVIFATSSIDIVIQPLENFLGIEKSMATELEFQNGISTGRLVGASYFSKKKKTAAQIWLEQNGFNPSDIFFYSDSYVDIPLLEYCGNPVAVNPDRRLKREAKKRGWKIKCFKELLGEGTSFA